MSRPEIDGVPNYFPWATADIVEFQVIDGEQVAVANKKAPLIEHTNYGLKYREPVNTAELNYQLHGAYLWYEFLDKRYGVGDTRETSSTETATQISNRWGGTWIQQGSYVVGTTTIYVYEKTA